MLTKPLFLFSSFLFFAYGQQHVNILVFFIGLVTFGIWIDILYTEDLI